MPWQLKCSQATLKVLIVLVFYLVIGVPIGAIVLRAAVALVNKVVGGASQETLVETPSEFSGEYADPENPYNAPTIQTVAAPTVIPEPTFGRAYLITFC